jgi:hypothetical protein
MVDNMLTAANVRACFFATALGFLFSPDTLIFG